MGEEAGSNAVTVGTQTDERVWRQEELGEKEQRPRKRVSVGVQTNESFLRLLDEDRDLLPGLPDDITLDQIVPKLPWTAFHVLSSVCRRWLQAIRWHKVHDARVRSHSTDTLIAIHYYDYFCLTLYSMTDKDSYVLPPVPRGPPYVLPRVRREPGSPIPESCVALNGKIYVLGGEYQEDSGIGSRKVYVLDLVGQREWRQCASMKHRRYNCGYGAKDRKIYVFGGAHQSEPVRGCEVYDPEQNSWSEIAPMEFWRHRHRVASLGEELFVYGGEFWVPRPARAFVLEAYHPVKNEWRRVGEHPNGEVFMALGKLHVITEKMMIDVYDHERNTWSHLHSINLGGFDSEESDSILPYDVVAVNDELLVAFMDESDGVFHVFRGKGLGGNSMEILFQEEAHRDESMYEVTFPCTIQL